MADTPPSEPSPAPGPVYPSQIKIPCIECGNTMVWRGAGTRWNDNYQIETVRFECQSTACQTSAELTYRIFIPIDVARMRPTEGPA